MFDFGSCNRNFPTRNNIEKRPIRWEPGSKFRSFCMLHINALKCFEETAVEDVALDRIFRWTCSEIASAMAFCSVVLANSFTAPSSASVRWSLSSVSSQCLKAFRASSRHFGRIFDPRGTAEEAWWYDRSVVL